MRHEITGCGISIVLLGLLIVMLLGCAQAPSAHLKNPFETSTGYFSLGGYTSGYEPGKTYRMRLKLNNVEGETWRGSYGIYLIDSGGVVLNIAVDTQFTLWPHSSTDADFDMVLPGDLGEGKYGLYLVFPGRGASTSVIFLGDEIQPTEMPVPVGEVPSPGNPWPGPGDLPSR